MNFNRSIFFTDQPATLRLVEPDLAKLEPLAWDEM